MGRSASAITIGAEGPSSRNRGVARRLQPKLLDGGRSWWSPISISSSQGKREPTLIELTGGAAGLPKTSFAVCHQVTTLDRAKLTKRIGSLPTEVLREVEEGLRAAMDLD